MKSVHLLLLGVAAFLAACGQTNPESSVQVPTELVQTSPDQAGSDKTGSDQTDSRLSAQGVAWNIATVVASGYQSKYGGGAVSMVLDASSRPVISYPTASDDLMLVFCGNTTCSSGNIIRKVDGIDSNYDNRSGRFNALTLDASGRPVISYSAFDNDSADNLKLVHCGYTDCSGGNIYQTLRSSFPGPAHSSLVLDAAGKPVVSFEVADQNFVVYHCNDVNCATGNESFIDSYIGDTSLALDANGNPVVGYAFNGTLFNSNPNYSLNLVHCGNANCSSGKSLQTVDRTAIVAQSPSLVLDSVGRPVMAYYDATNKDLKLAYCGNANCSNGNFIKALESAGDVGNSPSLKRTASGKPVIAHGDATNGTLKLMQCGDVYCSDGSINVSQTLDKVGAGYATKPSLALDASGNSVIAYGTSGGQIRLARQVPNTITPPTLTPRITGTLGNNGWYTSDVTLGWALVDNGSTITTSSGCGTVSFTTDVSKNVICSATNGGGITNKTATIKRDATKPSLSVTVNPNPVLKYLSATVTPNASDNLSGVVSRDCATATTNQVGSFSVTCTAKDSAGNSSTASASYTVISASQGIANLMNQVNASPVITQILKSQLLNILVGVQANLAVSKAATLALLSQFISVVNSQPPYPYGIDRSTAAVLSTSAQLLIASINVGP